MATQFPYLFATPARALAIFFALGLGGCGRYGPLEPPPDANAPPKPANANPTNMSALSHPAIPPIVPPKHPFFLDPLLK